MSGNYSLHPFLPCSFELQDWFLLKRYLAITNRYVSIFGKAEAPTLPHDYERSSVSQSKRELYGICRHHHRNVDKASTVKIRTNEPVARPKIFKINKMTLWTYWRPN